MNPLGLLNTLEIFVWLLAVTAFAATIYFAVGRRMYGLAGKVAIFGGVALVAAAVLFYLTSTLIYLQPTQIAVRFVPDAPAGQQLRAVEGSGLQSVGLYDEIFTYPRTRQVTLFHSSQGNQIPVRDAGNFEIKFDVNVEWEIIPELALYVYQTRGAGMDALNSHVVSTFRSVSRASFAELGINTSDFASSDLLSDEDLASIGMEAEEDTDENAATNNEPQEAALTRIGNLWFQRFNEELEGNADEYIACLEQNDGDTSECNYTGSGVRVTAVYVRNPDFNDEWEALILRAENSRTELQATINENANRLELQRGQTAERVEAQEREAELARIERENDAELARIEREILIADANAEAEAIVLVAQANAEALQLQVNAYGSPENYIMAQQVAAINPNIEFWVLEGQTLPVLPFGSQFIPMFGSQAGDVINIPEDEIVEELPDEAVIPIPEEPDSEAPADEAGTGQ